MKLVSVIIPVYNVEKYLDECLNSVVNQTYKRLQIIVVDDGSTDASWKIYNRYSERDSRFLVIKKSNGGLSEARNVGIDAAKGTYICFVDSDDIIQPEYVEKLVAKNQSSGADVTVSGFNTVHENGDVFETFFLGADTHGKCISGVALLSLMLEHGGWKYVVVWNKLYKRSLFENERFPVGHLFEDEFIDIKIFSEATVVDFVDQVLYKYRLRSGSITKSPISRQKLDDAIDLYHFKINEFTKFNFSDLLNKTYQSYYDWSVSIGILSWKQLSNRRDKIKNEFIFLYKYYMHKKSMRKKLILFVATHFGDFGFTLMYFVLLLMRR